MRDPAAEDQPDHAGDGQGTANIRRELVALGELARVADGDTVINRAVTFSISILDNMMNAPSIPGDLKSRWSHIRSTICGAPAKDGAN